jgi:uncharacterized protein
MMIHKYCVYGLYILCDIGSGAIHLIDEGTFNALDRVQCASDIDDIEDAEIADDLRELVLRGELFAPDNTIGLGTLAEGQAMTKANEQYKKSPLPIAGDVVKAICLHVSHDCNLRCRYCFAGAGAYGGDRSLMTAETGRAAIDFLIAHSGTRHNLEVDFFGGEPTLNWDVVVEVVRYAREIERGHGKNIRFTLTTNGILLNDEKTAFINANMDNVVLSIDGRREVNERMRGGYDVIVPIYKKFAASRGDRSYYLRGTYTSFNKDFAADALHLADLGFDKISVEPVVCGAEEEYALKLSDVDALSRQYDLLAAEMLQREQDGRGFSFFHFNLDLDGGPCIVKQVSGCGAGMEYVAISPVGDIYPCHQLVGIDEFYLGNISIGFRRVFSDVSVLTKSECQSCWAKFYCGGGCHAAAYFQNGDVTKPYALGCALMKKRVETAIYMQAARFLHHDSFHHNARQE